MLDKQHLRIHALWLAVCIAVWFLARHETTGDEEPVKSASSLPQKRMGNRPPAPPPASANSALMTETASRVMRMTPEEFGARYAELLTGPESSRSLLERAAMLADINPQRAAAAYAAYKKRAGSAFTENSNEIRPLLTAAGEHDGAAALEAIRQATPALHEISSLIHGWAMKDPQAAVAWFNALPADSSELSSALTGLMWGLGQGDPATARAVFAKLSPEDQQTSAEGLARALYTSRGPSGLDELLAGLSPELVAKCIMGSVPRTRSRPPAEVVPWLAGHLSTVPQAAGPLRTAWQRWQATDPASAGLWHQSHPELQPLLAGEEAPEQ